MCLNLSVKLNIAGTNVPLSHTKEGIQTMAKNGNGYFLRFAKKPLLASYSIYLMKYESCGL